MKISKIKVSNFRLLKSFELDLEEDLSLVIGKNNSGKTSLLAILDKFLNNKPFNFDDFNIDYQKDIKTHLEAINNDSPSIEISLYLYISYNEEDDLSNISYLMLDLDPENKMIVIKFEYILLEKDFGILKSDYEKSKLTQETETTDQSIKQKSLFEFLKINHKKYFSIRKKSLEYDFSTKITNEESYINLTNDKTILEKIINFQLISARRNVSNLESNKNLSILSSRYYELKENRENETEEVRKFKEELSKTDIHLNKVYTTLFENIIKKVGKFGGTSPGDSVIEIKSTLQHKELLRDNTTVMYNYSDENSLPENYNGLGYLNLINIIFEIELLLNNFKKQIDRNEQPADINLLFIEEPEAHTHPQMQYVFIKNIKNVLNESSRGEEDGLPFNLQTIITTHSCHITSESDFNDIKYFYKVPNKCVIAKNLRDLESEYEKDGEKEKFRFLKQYLTIHRSELFFVDKVIFIEGDTERILLPEMMRKIDAADPTTTNPLLSQNISIIEVGAYAHIFEKFIDFIGMKSLIITDIDSSHYVTTTDKNEKTKTVEQKCRVDNGLFTTNHSLSYFLGSYVNTSTKKMDLSRLLSLSGEEKIIKKCEKTRKWIPDTKGHVLVVYQTHENNTKNISYCARSFEDSFFHINRKFIVNRLDDFKSLKNRKYFRGYSKDSYYLAEKCIDKKPSFAMEILLNSLGNEDWKIPSYIREGLLWLREK